MASKEPADPHRATLNSSVAAIIKSCGYTAAEPLALESLVEMVQSFISQIGKSAKQYSEVANRSQVMVPDISLALIDSGVSLSSLKKFADMNMRKPNPVPTPDVEPEHKAIDPLAVNSSSVQPAYVHENLPTFPDKHTYIQTPAQKLPTTDYQHVRQKASLQRKNTETALTKFIAKTGERNYYCDDTDNAINKAFPLIACKPSALSYLSALMPKDEREFEVFDLKHEQDLPEMPADRKRAKMELERGEGQFTHTSRDE